MIFNKKCISLMGLMMIFGHISAMDWPGYPNKRPRNDASLAPRKKQRIESFASPQIKVSSFHKLMTDTQRQDRISEISQSGTAEEISASLSGSQACDIGPLVLENIFSKNTAITELQKIDFHKQLNELRVNLEGTIVIENGMNLLHIAADNNELQLVTHLLKHSNIDPNTIATEMKMWTPVHFTTNPEVINVLARAGANLNAKDINGKTAADLIDDNTSHDKKLKICLATHGVFAQFSTEKQTEDLAEMTRRSVAQTMGTQLHKWLENRRNGRDRRSFFSVPPKFHIEDSSSSEDNEEMD